MKLLVLDRHHPEFDQAVASLEGRTGTAMPPDRRFIVYDASRGAIEDRIAFADTEDGLTQMLIVRIRHLPGNCRIGGLLEAELHRRLTQGVQPAWQRVITLAFRAPLKVLRALGDGQ